MTRIPWDKREYTLELAVLPLLAAIIAACFGASLFQLINILSPWHTPWWIYIALLGTSLSGVFLSILQVYYQLPSTWRFFEMAFISCLMAVLARYFSDLPSMAVFFLTALVWLAAVYHNSTCVNLFPIPKADHPDPQVRQQLEKLKSHMEIYRFLRIEKVKRTVWTKSALMMIPVVYAFFFTRITGQSETAFALTSTVLVAAILTFVGLIQLGVRKNEWAENKAIRVSRQMGDFWPVFIGAIVVLAVGCSWFLPADISPLYYFNWERLFSVITGIFFRRRFEPNVADQMNPASSGPDARGYVSSSGVDIGVDALLPFLYAVLPFLILLFAGKLLSMALTEETEKLKKPGQWIKYVFIWPYILIKRIVSIIKLWMTKLRAGRLRTTFKEPMTQVNGKEIQTDDFIEKKVSDLSPRMRVRRIYQQLLSEAAREGFFRKPDQTVIEYKAYLTEKKPSVDPFLSELSAAYQIARYSPQEISPSLADKVKEWWKRFTANLR
jgi:hypothetical protein